MRDAPKYPRIAHLHRTPAATHDDVLLPAALVEPVLGHEVVVEEKLDGANVSIWIDDGVPHVATRGGEDTMDRGGQRGRLRGWAFEHADELRDALGERFVLYGEWLLRRHSVPYSRLPSPIVGLDVWDGEAAAFLPVDDRDRILQRAGVPAPPRLYQGVLRSLDAVERLVGASRFGDARAEGLVIRPVAPGGDVPRIVKFVDPAWRRMGDEAWEAGAENDVVEG